MPYIPEDHRPRASKSPATPGEISYAIANLVKEYLFGQSLSYRLLNNVLGALEGAKMEFYRRVVVPYEEDKMRENGDVYPVSLTRGVRDDG